MSVLRYVAIVCWIGMLSASVHAETLDEIRKHVKARCDAYSSVDCNWKVVSKFTESYGKRVRFDPFGDDLKAGSTERLPATQAWTASFQSAGPKLRLSHNQPLWSARESRLRKFPRTLVSDGTESRSLEVYDSHTQGIWTKAQNPVNVGFDRNFTPILTQFLALHYPIASLFNPDATPTIETGDLDGQACVVLRWNHPRQEVGGRELPKYALWLDPAADYSARRYTCTRAGVLENDIRIELGQRDGMWVPTRWQYYDRHSAAGELMAVHSSELLDITLNEPIDDSLFVLAYPRGTIISDQRAPSREKLQRRPTERTILIGSNQRTYEVTRQQRAKAGSTEALLEELEQE